MIETLLVSEPIAPPWNFGSRRLIRELVQHCPDVRHRVLSTPGFRLDLEHVTEEPHYTRSAAERAPDAVVPLQERARLIARLLRPDRQQIEHLFLPLLHPATAWARRARAWKKRPRVQTVLHPPVDAALSAQRIFADRVVALSESTTQRLRAAGVANVVHVPPGVSPPAVFDSSQRLEQRAEFGFASDRPVIVYPGAYAPDPAPQRFAAAIEQLAPAVDLTFVFACRIRNDADRAVDQALRTRLSHLVERRRVRFLNDAAQVPDLLSAADLVVYPVSSPQGELDIPIVLLESLARGTPLVVSAFEPLNEILGTPTRSPRFPVGRAATCSEPEALSSAIAEMVCDKQRLASMSHAARAWVNARFHARSLGAAHALLYLSLE